ncbi:hypothetical protein K4L44_17665 [Halosquirtibacter laminarini]|uniref:Uncharacterized protein n=1 Tax=Halosquirtibacter laminarini TaxID=3374600 RepID=A0AC61NFE7_9BACT|nr:hypothetical protein K4L44_17665 [Prolixibacteraceae bacterium]
MKGLALFYAIFMLVSIVSCKPEKEVINSLSIADITIHENGIIPTPDGVPKSIEKTFSKYTKITAPNGRPIHFFAQSEVADRKIVRARQILEMYLTDVKGSRYGGFKFIVANSMADRNAALFFFNDEASKEENMFSLILTPFNAQDLYATESFVEGSPEYLENYPRDASYEEILHLTQDYGITPMLPLYQKEIYDAAQESVNNGIYLPPSELPKADYDQEYLATVWDIYLDAWAYTPPPAQFGEYPYNTREMLKEKDTKGYKLVESFLPTSLTYNAHIHPDFTGVFHLNYTPNLSYTHKSKHLNDATLTGGHPSGLCGNDRDNKLTGNDANNTFCGLEGGDTINGKQGVDTVIFRGDRSEYTIETNVESTIITDKVAYRDGVDTLINIEKIQFKDQTINL